MNGMQASGAGGRFREAVLGSVAGLGARMVLAGAARLLGFKSGPVAVVGGMAGLVGALVGGGLARRQRRFEPGPTRPRRGPSGRERYWHFEEGSSPSV